MVIDGQKQCPGWYWESAPAPWGYLRSLWGEGQMLPRSHLGMCEAWNHVLEVVRVAEMPALHNKEWVENENESKSRSRSEGASVSCKEWYDSSHKHGAGVIGGSCCDHLCMWSSMTTRLICDEVSIANTIKINCMGWLMLCSSSSSLECKHQWRSQWTMWWMYLW